MFLFSPKKRGKNPLQMTRAHALSHRFIIKYAIDWQFTIEIHTHKIHTHDYILIASLHTVPYRVSNHFFFLYKRIGEKIGRKMFDLLPVMCVRVFFAHSLFISLWLSFARSFHKIITNLDKLIAFCVSPVTATVMHHHHQQPNWHFAWYYLYFRFFLTRATALELLALKWWQQAKNSY